MPPDVPFLCDAHVGNQSHEITRLTYVRLKRELVAKRGAGRRELIVHINLAAILQLHLVPESSNKRNTAQSSAALLRIAEHVLQAASPYRWHEMK
eukprot:scaffold40782_cov21-Tisochrysis_lutea.AAC.2